MNAPLLSWWDIPVHDLLNPAHAGLYLDRCLPMEPENSEEKKEGRKKLYRTVIRSLQPGGTAAKGWEERRAGVQRHLEKGAPNRAVRCFVVQTTGRMLLHPSANGTVTDGGILLHHTWGVPYLPGSGLKGLARAQAIRRGLGPQTKESSSNVEKDSVVRKDTKTTDPLNPDDLTDLELLLGPDRNAEYHLAGAVQFLDALWVPGRKGPLELEVVTPHHTDYYSGGGEHPPTDALDPVPTERLAVAEGIQFQVILEAIQAPPAMAEPWLQLAEELLLEALRDLGFSAWTVAGFGRMERVGGGGKPVAPLVPKVEWQPASLSFNPGNQTLTATLGDGRKATVQGGEGKTVFDSLPAEMWERLKAKKTVAVRVRVEPLGGNRLKIAALERAA